MQCEAGLVAITAGDPLEGGHLGSGHRGQDVRLLGYLLGAPETREDGRGGEAERCFARGDSPFGPFERGDGQTVFLGIQNEREWKEVCDEILGREGTAEDYLFDTNSRRVENRDELHAEIERVFFGLSSGAEEARQAANYLSGHTAA